MEERDWEERTGNRFSSKAGEIVRSGISEAAPVLSGTVAGEETGQSAWDVFAASGKVRDYLLYKSASEDRSF